MTDLSPAVRTLARLARVLERTSGELSLPQYRVLAMVAGGDERASHLADRLALAKPTITAVVDGLVDRGLLSRSAVHGDRRAARIQVTAEGRKALTAAEVSMSERVEALLSRTQEPAAIIAALAELGRALDEATAERIASEVGSRRIGAK